MLKDGKRLVQYGLVWICGWQMHLDPCLHLNDLGSDLQDLQPDSLKGRRSKSGALEQVRAEGVQQDVGRRVQEYPKLVGKEAMA